jgi:hypothetical protein
LMRGPDWVLPVKLTVFAAMLLWGLLIFAPAATLSWALAARTLLQKTVACSYWNSETPGRILVHAADWRRLSAFVG